MPELRESGIDVLGKIPWGVHFCNFYETKQDLIDTLIPYFKAGLENNEFCLWVMPNSKLITVEEAKRALGKNVTDLDQHFLKGNIEILNGLDWYLKENIFSLERVMEAWGTKLKQALALGYEGMRVSGDTFWLTERDWKDFFAYEKQLNDFVTGLPISVLCTYPLAKSGASEILDVVQAHQFAITRRQGEWEIIETPELIQAKAEIKKLNEELEQRVAERTKELASANIELRREIAERKQAEEELRRSEDRIRLIIDTIPTIAWSLGPDGVVDFLSQRWLDYSGIDLEQYVQDPMEPIYPEDRSRVMEKWKKNMAGGEFHEDEIRLRRADGEYRWFLVRIAPLHNEEGKIIKWYGVSTDIENSKRAENALRQSHEEIRRLTEHLQKIREEERTSIAREIHDELGQQLTAIKMDVVWIDKKIPGETTDIKRKLKNIIGLLDGSNQSIRRILSELRPRILDNRNWLEATEWLGRQFTKTTEVPIKFTHPENDIRVSEQIATCIFRVCQEAFTNIARHSHAKNVSVSIKVIEENIVLNIEDDGIGFDPVSIQNKRSFGILGMRERVLSLSGKFELISSPGRGTKIIVSLPAEHK